MNTYPPRKVYWGPNKMSGEVILAAGLVMFTSVFNLMCDNDYLFNNYAMAGNHYNMGTWYFYFFLT